MAQDWSVHALVYFYSVGSDLLGVILYWHLDLELVDMTRREIIAAWNAQADDANSWHHLGEDEKLEWAMKLEREACAKVCEVGQMNSWGCAKEIRARGQA